MASSESSHVTFPIPLTPTPRHLSNGATDTYTSAATMMALVHNSFTRGFNTVYHVAPKVPESDVRNFLQYADQLYLALKIHHTEEEEVVFPILEEALGEEGLMKVSVEEHGVSLQFFLYVVHFSPIHQPENNPIQSDPEHY